MEKDKYDVDEKKKSILTQFDKKTEGTKKLPIADKSISEHALSPGEREVKVKKEDVGRSLHLWIR